MGNGGAIKTSGLAFSANAKKVFNESCPFVFKRFSVQATGLTTLFQRDYHTVIKTDPKNSLKTCFDVMHDYQA